MSYVHDFVQCLTTISHSRAGWDYDLSPEERAKEIAEEKAALVKARAIWAENAANVDVLREAFKKAQPLATLREFDAEA
jgi:hypothetical protein